MCSAERPEREIWTYKKSKAFGAAYEDKCDSVPGVSAMLNNRATELFDAGGNSSDRNAIRKAMDTG
ncbi:hypothetical protein SAMN06297251_103130 [Fulvimarina manganoxydans]|uniref:Uncharacterized protein n=1 Tax=Fulvimarina manganoxydans TaxID=937218 RepID=A0A1W1ZU98_9HYPH|nr:hypothetical protein SAMN06297251_103130 [Fulvimarina manganoxydans]